MSCQDISKGIILASQLLPKRPYSEKIICTLNRHNGTLIIYGCYDLFSTGVDIRGMRLEFLCKSTGEIDRHGNTILISSEYSNMRSVVENFIPWKGSNGIDINMIIDSSGVESFESAVSKGRNPVIHFQIKNKDTVVVYATGTKGPVIGAKYKSKIHYVE